MPLIDSHCHLDRLDTEPYEDGLAGVLAQANSEGVDGFLCVGINLDNIDAVTDIAHSHPQVWASVGVHPNEAVTETEPSLGDLIALAQREKVIAIGETGLDYFRSEGDLQWQHDRFRHHIRAAKACNKPVIVHCREAKEDTIRILAEENAAEVGGIMHCFVDDQDTAEKAMEMGFYISFSGIVTFNSAKALQKVAQTIPEERLLIETDCPYLAPAPHRGKPNYPAYVRHVAEKLATLRETSVDHIADVTSRNFRTLFNL